MFLTRSLHSIMQVNGKLVGYFTEEQVTALEEARRAIPSNAPQYWQKVRVNGLVVYADGFLGGLALKSSTRLAHHRVTARSGEPHTARHSPIIHQRARSYTRQPPAPTQHRSRHRCPERRRTRARPWQIRSSWTRRAARGKTSSGGCVRLSLFLSCVYV